MISNWLASVNEPNEKNFISYLRHFTYSWNPQVYKITSPLIKAQICDFEMGRGGGKGAGLENCTLTSEKILALSIINVNL